MGKIHFYQNENSSQNSHFDQNWQDGGWGWMSRLRGDSQLPSGGCEKGFRIHQRNCERKTWKARL